MTDRFKSFIVITIVITLILSGWSFARTESSNIKLHAQVGLVCAEHKLLAEIAKETLATQIENSKSFLPKINFPGLPHAQLIKLIETKELKEAQNLGKLQAIAKQTC